MVRQGFLSPRDKDLATALFRRGALRRKPALWVNDAEFRKIRRLDTDEMLALEREAIPLGSQPLRYLLPVGLALALVFFFVTQRELFNTGVTVITAVAAMLPALPRVFSQLGPSAQKR